jgi:hypothetical protein
MKSMYMIKELYNRRQDAYIWQKCIIVLSEQKVENTTNALMLQGPPTMALCFNTHNFSPMP